MPTVLALDTATAVCTLALSDGTRTSGRHERLERAHNRHILRMLEDVLAGRLLQESVDLIACGVGPGSFTGLRVAVSVAQGLAWAQALPVQAFCSLEAQVYSAAARQLVQDGDWVLTTIDAQIDQVYWSWGRFSGSRFLPEGDPIISPPEAVDFDPAAGPVVMLGSGMTHLQRMPAMTAVAAREGSAVMIDITPEAAVMAELFASGRLATAPIPAHALMPRYVQQDIGWKKLSEQKARG